MSVTLRILTTGNSDMSGSVVGILLLINLTEASHDVKDHEILVLYHVTIIKVMNTLDSLTTFL